MDILEIDCKRCGTSYSDITACSAVHDHELIDVVVTCPQCELVLNGFISLSELTEVQSPEEEHQ